MEVKARGISTKRPTLGEQKTKRQQIKGKRMQKKRIKKNIEKTLEEYRGLVASDSEKARNAIKRLPYKDDFYLLMCIAQTYLDESLLTSDNRQRVYLEKRKWRMAERYIIKAFQLNPDNAEVLYTMGRVRMVNDGTDVAIFCFNEILGMDPEEIGNGKFGRGLDFAKELINDARFELYRIYFDRDPNLSKKYLSLYKAHLKRGIKTIFIPLEKFLL